MKSGYMSEIPEKRRRLTAAQKKERADFKSREARTKEWLSNQALRANKLRSKDKEFHGLEREFINLQNKMLRDYEISKDIKHPRDVGTVREVLLRAFFLENRLLPQRYAVSKSSVRVASTSGHLSNEIDILFYNAFDSFTLMQRQDVYEVLPVEYCYGAIQVKSKLSKKELKSGFDNIASFKRLRRMSYSQNYFSGHSDKIQNEGFGIIFAYDTDMDWADVVAELRLHAKAYDKSVLPNAVFILSKGYFQFGDENFSSSYNSDIKEFNDITIYGIPDRQGYCLYSLYEIIFNLLKKTQTQEAFPHHYFRLPLTAGDYSYEYRFGNFAEFGHCEEHGDYPRTFTSEKLSKLISWCQTAEPINWIKATDLAYGKPGDNTEAYVRQPGDVRIYNPEGLPLTDILVADKEVMFDGKEVITKVLAFDSIKSCGLDIFIPYYYQLKEDLVQGCPKCKRRKGSSGIDSQ
ncbi:Uncharacterised protein [Pseudomonas luteola]|uniref:DUF6602 domain-containing protein n=3 Tax=Pseudomonas TaxID=286 RepID=A0A2X2C9N6_PSELU|nr:hypothetical protein SAMN05216409_11952 [Pseudomonas lutea]SPZ05262.1 Uncharacterised protein [Pseudomonas luteola]